MLEDLPDLLNDHQMYHSDFQMDYLITGVSGSGTLYGQYKQALRELTKRCRGLRHLYAQRKLNQIDRDEIIELRNVPRDYGTWTSLADATRPAKHRRTIRDNAETRREAVKLEQLQLAADELAAQIHHTEREFYRFYRQAKGLKATLGELTPERRNQLDRETWKTYVERRIVVEMTAMRRLSEATAGLTFACPVEWLSSFNELTEHEDARSRWLEKHPAGVYAIADTDGEAPAIEEMVQKLTGNLLCVDVE